MNSAGLHQQKNPMIVWFLQDKKGWRKSKLGQGISKTVSQTWIIPGRLFRENRDCRESSNIISWRGLRISYILMIASNVWITVLKWPPSVRASAWFCFVFLLSEIFSFFLIRSCFFPFRICDYSFKVDHLSPAFIVKKNPLDKTLQYWQTLALIHCLLWLLPFCQPLTACSIRIQFKKTDLTDNWLERHETD